MNTNLHSQININPAACAARNVVRAIQQSKHSAFFVGGGVRDLLLGLTPQDFDIATSARPGEITHIFPGAIMVGAKFGVMLVKHLGHAIEIATFREEGQYHDRRRPDLVKFSNIENDAKRRDFTINALYYDPIRDQLVDFCGGLNDLKHRRIKTVGSPAKRFEEDALRLLRCIRFAANLDFDIEHNTLQVLSSRISDLQHISVERQREELVKGFTGSHPDKFLYWLDRSGALKTILTEVWDLHGCEQPAQYHPEGDVFVHTRLLLTHLKQGPSPELAMAALLHDIGKPDTQTFDDRIRFNGHDKIGAEKAEIICRRLRFSNSEIEKISTMVKRHMQFANVRAMRASTLRKFLSAPTIDDELELHRADCLASHQNIENYKFACEQLMEFREDDYYRGGLPAPLITGADLINAGFQPGPAFSPVLRQLFDEQLDGNIREKSDGIARAIALMKSKMTQ